MTKSPELNPQNLTNDIMEESLSMDRNGEDEVTQQAEATSHERIDYSILLKRFNQNMLMVTSLGLAFILFQMGSRASLPFILGSGLVWLNMLMLAKGLGGVMNGERSLVGLLLIKFAILLGGVYGLAQLFPDQRLSLILGCSTWVCALMLMGQVKVSTQSVSLILLLVINSYAFNVEAKPTEAEMLKGEVWVTTTTIPNSPMPKIVAEGIIKVAAKDLWVVISDCANFKKTMPSILESRFLGHKNGFKRCELVVDLPFPISNLRSVVDVKLTETEQGFTRTWKLVEGDYHKNSGEWKLTKRKDGYTSLRYMVHVEPKISIPDFIQRAAQKSKIPGIFEDLADLMKQRGKLLP